jgi:hypothetical protein
MTIQTNKGHSDKNRTPSSFLAVYQQDIVVSDVE